MTITNSHNKAQDGSQNNFRIEIRELLKIAIPLASAQVAQSATGFFDTIMMGRMGADTLAAGGLAVMIYFVIMLTTSGVVMGVSPLVAEAFGAGKTARIRHIASQGLWLALIVVIPAMVLTAYLDRWLSSAGQSETTVILTNQYLDIMLWGLFPAAGFAALRSTVSALSEARPVMYIVVLGTVFNIVGNYILGFGKLGFPRMELSGLALSSMLTLWGMFVAMVLYICLHKRLKTYRIFSAVRRFHPRMVWDLAWLGVPIGLFSALESGFFMVITFWMGLLGTTALAAHQIIFQTIMMVFMVPLGISYATTVRVGQWLGRKNAMGVQRAIRASVVITFLCTVSFSILFLLFPQHIVGLYLDVHHPDNAEIVALALPLLTIAALGQVLDGIQKAVYGALQGLQDTRIPTMLNVLGFWGVGLSVGYGLAFGLGMGSKGLWIGQSVAIATVAGLFLWRFRTLMAQHNRKGPVTVQEKG